MALVPADRRRTLIAMREPGNGNAVYRFDIRLQGENETVFFDSSRERLNRSPLFPPSTQLFRGLVPSRKG